MGPVQRMASIHLTTQNSLVSDPIRVKSTLESKVQFRPVNAEIMNSETILAGARQLDPHILAGIHDRYYPVVYRYVRYRLDDDQACEDIAAEVFLRLLDALHHQRGPNQNLQGWLLGTASHLVNDHFRRSYVRKVNSLEDQDLISNASTEQSVDQAWQKREVREAIFRLTEDQRHVLALRFSEDRSLEETAELMGKTIGAVKTLQFRALASLRRIIEGRNNDRRSI